MTRPSSSLRDELPSQNHYHCPTPWFSVPSPSKSTLHCWSPSSQGPEPAGKGTYKKCCGQSLGVPEVQQQVPWACLQLLWYSKDSRFAPAPTSTTSTASSPAPRPDHPPVHWWELATPALLAGCSVGFAAPGVTLPTLRRLSDTPQGQRGYKWKQRSRPYIPWAPTTLQLWEAYRLLHGEGEWATPGVRYISEGSSRRSAAKPSLRWECTLCPQLVSSKADGRGHHQSSHLGGQRTCPLCNCPSVSRGFNSCTVLAKHLDLQHNADPTMVQQVPPFMHLKYIDRVAAAPTTGPPPKKHKH